jgi:hypothetical protein
VEHDIPVYDILVFQIPTGVCKRMIDDVSKFWWDDDENNKKMH